MVHGYIHEALRRWQSGFLARLGASSYPRASSYQSPRGQPNHTRVVELGPLLLSVLCMYSKVSHPKQTQQKRCPPVSSSSMTNTGNLSSSDITILSCLSPATASLLMSAYTWRCAHCSFLALPPRGWSPSIPWSFLTHRQLHPKRTTVTSPFTIQSTENFMRIELIDVIKHIHYWVNTTHTQKRLLIQSNRSIRSQHSDPKARDNTVDSRLAMVFCDCTFLDENHTSETWVQIPQISWRDTTFEIQFAVLFKCCVCFDLQFTQLGRWHGPIIQRWIVLIWPRGSRKRRKSWLNVTCADIVLLCVGQTQPVNTPTKPLCLSITQAPVHSVQPSGELVECKAAESARCFVLSNDIPVGVSVSVIVAKKIIFATLWIFCNFQWLIDRW